MPATINRSLSTLRKALRLAYVKRLVARLPKFRMEPGERQREFILDPEVETVYLAACPDPLADAAGFILQTGLRLGEAVNLKWSDITGDSVHIRQGKTKTRSVPWI